MINLTPLARLILARRVKESLRWVDNCEQLQRDLLAWLLKSARGTQWGEKYQYGAISSYEEFAQRVPVNTYEDLSSWIMRQL